MLPNEYEPLKLNKTQQDVHSRYTAMGFKICPRPFAGNGDHLWFFMSLPTADDPRGIEFTINLQSGVAHRTGTQTTWQMEEAEKEFGATGERQGVSPPCEAVAESPVAAAEVEVVKPAPEKPIASEAEPVKTHGGLTPNRSPVKSVPVKKKQTALF